MRGWLMAGVAVVGLASGAEAQGPGARLPGNYNGALDAGAIKLRLALSIERGANGALGGALTSVDQGGVRLPATVLPQGDTAVRIEASGAVFQARISANGDTLAGTWDQGGATLPLTLVRGTALAAPARPQEPKRPFPYREEEVSFASVPGVRIAGTLTLPRGRGPFPAAVLITGSGQQDRDESLMGHKPFLVLADYLTRRGIAVLRMDDRGEGRSTGDFGRATSADFANDVEAAVRFLAARSDVARNKIGLIGHSEGGVIAPMVATRSRGVAYVVMLAGTGIPGDSLLRLQGAAVLRSSGASEEMVRRQGEVQGRIFAAARAGSDSADAARRIRAALTPQERAAGASSPDSIPGPMRALLAPWFRYFLGYDPRPALRRLTVPTLALNGSLDVQVPAKENLAAIDSALRAAGNRDYRVLELAGLNHLFQTARTGSPGEYATIEETMSPAALEAVASWIVQRFVR
ncbi:MAG TPA: alpha/beta fold hydrolase [Longimicrobium sp.]|jgi:hypothetical protein